MTSSGFRIYPCDVAGIEVVEAATDHVFPRHWHEQYGIGVVYRGAQKSLSGRGMVEAGPGHVITVNPGEVHDGVPIGDAGRSWRMLYFDPAIIGNSDAEDGKAAREFPLPVLVDPRVVAWFQRLFLALTDRRTPASALEREELLLQLLDSLVLGRSESPSIDPASTAVREALTMIDDDPTATHTLADLSGRSGMSQFQIVRGIAKATGLTPHAYLMQRRIDLARRLIAGGTALADAAAASGFADQSHMTRLFIRKFGVSPGSYATAVT
ncbi:AraC family transcriptional regulator [Phyllobacterium lublinensis]|uniref:AraC family transcriptional regulator n=1 Tax=Phyllobacterium lublinensis TaxID=2875708 RepID=UPI001CCED998|nr:AraC family transcriptional regulator [Phyllobacterium sp. 2063]MBZ9654935.1 AraC family transcriptional regulator [Phyllobacterium sp. 2063]